MNDNEFIQSVAAIPDVIQYLNNKSTALSLECADAMIDNNYDAGKDKALEAKFYTDLSQEIQDFLNL